MNPAHRSLPSDTATDAEAISQPPATSGPDKRVRFSALDSWRGICALLVAAFHIPLLWSFYQSPFIRNSWLFVDFFFVLSGFVIAHAYEGQIRSGADFAAFLVRRIGRVWPLHVAVLIAFVCFELAKLAAASNHSLEMAQPAFTGSNSASSLVTNVFLLQSLGTERTLTWNAVSWSISAEFLAYIVFGLFYLLWRPRILVLEIVTVIASIVILATVAHRYMDATYDYGAFRCLYGFFCGHFVYRLFRLRQSRTSSSRMKLLPANPGRAKRVFATLLEGIAVIGVVLFVTRAGMGPWSIAAPGVFGFAVFVFAHEQGYVSALLSGRALRIAGVLSYSIYMTQALVITLFTRAAATVQSLFHIQIYVHSPLENNNAAEQVSDWHKLMQFGNPLGSDLVLIVYFATIVCFSAVTYKLVERPGRFYFKSLSQWISPAPKIA